MKEKIINILINELCYCYCNNCEYGNWDKYYNECDDCHRKYQNWKLATQIAEQIIKEVNINAK